MGSGIGGTVNDQFFKTQIRRFAGMPGQPTDEIAIKERIKALERSARSETHAVRIVDSLLETNQFFPTVSDITQAAEYIGAENLPQSCEKCKGEPFVIREHNGAEYAVRCTCERGQYLKRRDKERAAA